jgi:hypothetical protein
LWDFDSLDTCTPLPTVLLDRHNYDAAENAAGFLFDKCKSATPLPTVFDHVH